MFAFLAPYKLYFEIGLILAIVAVITYGTHKILAHERKLGYDMAVAEYTERALVAEQAARKKEAELNTQIQEARDAATTRDQEITKLSGKLSNTSNSLLNTINSLRSKLSRDTIETARAKADTALSVFGECQKEYREMAENADRHAGDVKLLEDAWPH